MKKLLFCLIFLPLWVSAGADQIRGLVYEKNWAGLEQKLKSGEIGFPSGEQALGDYLLGYALLKQGKSREAVEPLRKCADSSFALNNYSHYYLGRILLSLEQGASAEEQFQQVVPINYIYFQSRLSLLERYIQAKKIEQAANEIYQLRQAKIPDRYYPEFLYLESGFYLAQNQPGPAQKKLAELYVNFPASAPARRIDPAPRLSPGEQLIRAGKLLEANNPGLAKEELKELKENLKKPDEKIYPRLLGLLARACFLSREYPAVVELEKEAKKDAKEADEFWFYLAWSYHRLNQDDRAREHYKKFQEKFKDSSYAPRAWYQLARLEQAAGNLLSALSHFEKLAKLYPDHELSEEARFQAGLIYFRQARYDRAAETFNKALPSAKNQDQFLYWLAKSYEKNEEREKAGQFRKQLMANFPISAYTYLVDPEPKPVNGSAMVHANFSAELPQEFTAGLALARFGFLELGREELHWQLQQKSYPFPVLLGLANQLMEIQAYALVTRLYYYYLSPKLSPEQKFYYYGYLYPRAFSELVEPRATKYQLDPALVYALIRAESNFDPSAVSSAGAMGLSQVMPFLADATMRKMGLEKSGRDQYHGPELNLEIGFYHLNELQVRYHDSGPSPWPIFLMLCAYNAGTQPVDQWFNQANKWDMPPDLWMETIAYPETKDYLKRVLAGIHIYRQLYPEIRI